MKKSALEIIQTLAKIGKILSKIIAVCCVVGTIGCLVGLVTLFALGKSDLLIGNVTIHGILQNSAQKGIGTIYAAMWIGLVFCIGEHILARRANRYFSNELAAGTPFTHEGARELKRLGIAAIVIPLVSTILASTAYQIVARMYADTESVKLDSFGSVGLGITFLVVSLLCQYGAEIKDGDNCQ